VKILRKIRVKNPLGLHARPATMIVKMLQASTSQVTFTYKQETIDARSIMGILSLAVTKHSLVTVMVEGEDAQETMRMLVDIFEMKFGE
jgi:phosphocarrier protein HPr